MLGQLPGITKIFVDTHKKIQIHVQGLRFIQYVQLTWYEAEPLFAAWGDILAKISLLHYIPADADSLIR